MLKIMCMILLYVSFVIGIILIILVIVLPSQNNYCEPSITSASGSAALSVCSGSLIFMENFSRLDKNKWRPEITLSDGSVSEMYFQQRHPKMSEK